MKLDIIKILNFPAKFSIVISYFFIVLSIFLFLYSVASLVSLLSLLTINFNKPIDYYLEIMKISEVLLASLLFTVIAYGIIKIIYRSKVEEVEQKLREQTKSSMGILPFESLKSIEDLEKYIFALLTFQILIILLESLSKDEDSLILLSKGISTSFIIISISIYLYLSKK